MSALFHAAAWGVPAGLLGTLVMDISGALAKLTGAGAGLPPHLFTRWLGHMLRGTFSHADITRAADVPLPIAFVVATHYAIGATLGLGFALIAHWLSPRPIPLSLPILYGIATTALAAFWMFPTMGFGIAGLDAPRELLLLRTTLFKHAMFGVGLAGAWAWFGR